jgi:hypothetical protein
MSLYLTFSNEIALGRGDGMSWHEDEPIGPKETESASLFMLYHYRFIWQRFKEHIYLAKEIILTCYYNRNETETVVADQLKQASSDYVLLGLVGLMEITLYAPAYRHKATLLSDRCQRSR